MDDLSLPCQRRDNLFPAGMQGFSSKQKTLSEWMQSPAGKNKIAEAEKDAWVPFNQQFPQPRSQGLSLSPPPRARRERDPGNEVAVPERGQK